MNSSNKVVACLIAVLVLVSFAFVSFAEEAPDVMVSPTIEVSVTEVPSVEDFTTEVYSTREHGTALDESEPYDIVTFDDRSFAHKETTKAPTHDSFGTSTDSFGTDTDSFGTETDSEEGGFLGFIKGIINKIIYFFMKIFAYLGLS